MAWQGSSISEEEESSLQFFLNERIIKEMAPGQGQGQEQGQGFWLMVRVQGITLQYDSCL